MSKGSEILIVFSTLPLKCVEGCRFNGCAQLVNLYNNYKWLVVDFTILRTDISNCRYKNEGLGF
jgi:hypothetical protein